jgi:AAA domain-containing protein
MSTAARVEEGMASIDDLVELWTGEQPAPACWIETAAIARARDEIEAALYERVEAVLLSGPSGHGKSFLLRALWHRPPNGFAPIFAPCAGVRADEVAARILATTRNHVVRDAPGALARSLRARSLRGARPLLLVDDLDRVAPETLAQLMAIARGSRVDVALVAATRQGTALDDLLALDLLPRSQRSVTIDAPWTRADAERLVAGLVGVLPSGADEWLAAIDLDGALQSANGNPRALRSALASQLRQLDLGRSQVESAIASPDSITPATPCEPAAISEPAPIPPPTEPPARVLPPSPQRAAPHSRARQRNPISGRLLAALAAALAIASVGASAVAWGAAHGRELAAWSRSTIVAYASDLHRRVVEWQPPKIPVAEIAADASAFASEQWQRIAAWKPPPLPKLPELPDLPKLRDAAPAPPPPVAAPPPPPIRVAVNSDPWSDVEIDGVAAGATPLVVELAPGPHRFRAQMADGRVVERELDVTEEQSRVVLR